MAFLPHRQWRPSQPRRNPLLLKGNQQPRIKLGGRARREFVQSIKLEDIEPGTLFSPSGPKMKVVTETQRLNANFQTRRALLERIKKVPDRVTRTEMLHHWRVKTIKGFLKDLGSEKAIPFLLTRTNTSVRELLRAGAALNELFDAGVEGGTLLKVGVPLRTLAEKTDFLKQRSIPKLSGGIWDGGMLDLKKAGLSIADLKKAGISAKELAGNPKHFPVADHITEFLKAGYSFRELLEAGIKPYLLWYAGAARSALMRWGASEYDFRDFGKFEHVWEYNEAVRQQQERERQRTKESRY